MDFWEDPYDLEREQIGHLLARFHLGHQRDGTPVERLPPHDLIEAVVDAVTDTNPGSFRAERGFGTAADVTAEDAIAGLELLPREQSWLDRAEVILIEAARARGQTWESLGRRLGRSANAMQQRYRRAGGTRGWPTRQPARPRDVPLLAGWRSYVTGSLAARMQAPPVSIRAGQVAAALAKQDIAATHGEAIRAVVTSGALIQPVTAPAGLGRTAFMAGLTAVWQAATGAPVLIVAAEAADATLYGAQVRDAQTWPARELGDVEAGVYGRMLVILAAPDMLTAEQIDALCDRAEATGAQIVALGNSW